MVENAGCLTASGDDYDRARMALQDRYVDALGEVTRASATADRLVLTGDGVESAFQPGRTRPRRVRRGHPLGAPVKLDGESAAGGSFSQAAFLRLDGRGRLTGTGGCRTFAGAYRLEGGTLTVTDLTLAGATTGCSADAAELDDALRTFLSTPSTISVEKDRLTLMRGGTGYGFTAAP